MKLVFTDHQFFKKVKLFQESMDKFGCTSPFGNNVDNICTDAVIGKQALELFERLSNKRYFMPECPYPCKFVKLLVISVKGRGNENTLKLDFNQYIKVTEAYHSYTELELIAEFGGYVGLFLGISVFDINQVFSKTFNYLKPN